MRHHDGAEGTFCIADVIMTCSLRFCIGLEYVPGYRMWDFERVVMVRMVHMNWRIMTGRINLE
jgi:hypothetical protein